MQKNDSGHLRSILLGLLAFVFAAIAVYGACMSYKVYSTYRRGKTTYEKIEESAVIKEEDGEKEEEENYTKTGCPIKVDFNALWKQNRDVIGWIYCEDTVISYPVLQGETNNTYLRTLMTGEYNTAGCIFMDVACRRDLGDYVSILYGHNMHDGSMFAMVDKYKDQSAYDEHPTYWYLTPEGNYRLDVLAGYITPSDDPVYSLFETKEEMKDFLDLSIGKSMFRASAYPDDVSHLFVFSTCDYKYEDARYILILSCTKESDILEAEGPAVSFSTYVDTSLSSADGLPPSPFYVSPGPAGSADGEEEKVYAGTGTPSVTFSYAKKLYGEKEDGPDVLKTTVDFSGVSFPAPGTYRYFVRKNLSQEISPWTDEVRILDVYVKEGSEGLSPAGFAMHPAY